MYAFEIDVSACQHSEGRYLAYCLPGYQTGNGDRYEGIGKAARQILTYRGWEGSALQGGMFKAFLTWTEAVAEAQAALTALQQAGVPATDNMPGGLEAAATR